MCFFCFRPKNKETNAVKRKSTAKTPSNKKVRTPKPESSGWELSDSEDEATPPKKAPLLQSALTRRVAGGVLRRCANLEGDVFVEVKIYNTNEILNVPPANRWEKAVVSLKYQGESDSPELAPLKTVLKLCRNRFTQEGTFFANKKI